MSDEEVKMHGKSLARLMAVQALYSLAVSPQEEDLEAILSRVAETPAMSDDENAKVSKPHVKLLREIVSGVTERQEEIDALILPHLKEGWDIAKLDVLLASMIRSAVLELKDKPDTPTGVILNEYINIAHAFYDTQEVGFANAVIDGVANVIRAA